MASLNLYANYNTIHVEVSGIVSPSGTTPRVLIKATPFDHVESDGLTGYRDPGDATLCHGLIMGLPANTDVAITATLQHINYDGGTTKFCVSRNLETASVNSSEVLTGSIKTLEESWPYATTNIKYIAPSPTGNDSNDGSEGSPWETAAFGVDQLENGMANGLILEDGTYNEERIAIESVNGTASAYKFIRARNRGSVTLTGSKTFGSGQTWTLHTGDIWYTDILASEFDSTHMPAWLMDTTADKHLLGFYNLSVAGGFGGIQEDASGPGSGSLELNTGTPGWHIDPDFSGTHHRLYVRTFAGTQPTADQISYTNGQLFRHRKGSYFIYDGLKFLHYASSIVSGGKTIDQKDESSAIYLSNDFTVVRHCDFTHTNFRPRHLEGSNTCERMLLEDCTFTTDITSHGFTRAEITNGLSDRKCVEARIGRGCVLRRNTITGYEMGMQFNEQESGSGGTIDNSSRNMDIYENTISNCNIVAIDYSPHLEFGISMAAYENTVANCTGILNIAKVNRGPIYSILNTGTNIRASTFKLGLAAANYGVRRIYHCASTSPGTRTDGAALAGISCLEFNAQSGNDEIIASDLRGTNEFYLYVTKGQDQLALSRIESNHFKSDGSITATLPRIIKWDNSAEFSNNDPQIAEDSADGEALLEMTGNVFDQSGELPNAPTILGVTNLLADVNGVHLGSIARIGMSQARTLVWPPNQKDWVRFEITATVQGRFSTARRL